jgi:hypothetical protein
MVPAMTESPDLETNKHGPAPDERSLLRKQPDRPRPRRFRFGLWRLFLLTTICAVAMGYVRLVDGDWLLMVILGGYILMLTLYFGLRLPHVVSQLWGFTEELKQIRRKRQELQQWTDERRRQLERQRASGDKHSI